MFREFSQNSDAPITRFEEMLKTNEVLFFDAVEFETIIQYYIDCGETHRAKRALQMAIDQHPFHIELLLLKTELLIFDEIFDEALSVLETIEDLEPNNEEVFIQKATICSKKKEHKKAIILLNSALEISDDPMEIWCLLGMEHMVLEDYEKAKNCFKRCIEEDPQDYQVLYNLLFCLEYLKNHQEAIAILNGILSLHPYNEIAWLEIGKKYWQLDQKEEALSAFDFAIISEDTFSGAYIEKGKLLEEMGSTNLAIEHYEQALQLVDPSAFLYIRIAQCHQSLGNDSLALQYFNKGINLDPSYEKAWTGIIDFFIAQEDLLKALYYSQKATQINDSSVAYWKRNALINKALQRFSEAEIAFQTTIELGNYELEIWEAWLDTLAFLNEWEKGAIIGQQAKEFYSQTATIDIRIAGFLLQQGKTIEAEYFIENSRQAGVELDRSLMALFPRLRSRI